MYRKEYMIQCESGLHARPASELVELTQNMENEITIVNLENDEEADAKSIIEILGLEADKGDRITIEADGADAEEAVNKIITLLDGIEN